jgi:hypothetical protein
VALEMNERFRSHTIMKDDPAWPSEIFQALKQARVRQASYVPDAGHSRLIELLHADSEIQTTPLTTEEEGVALPGPGSAVSVRCCCCNRAAWETAST